MALLHFYKEVYPELLHYLCSLLQTSFSLLIVLLG